MGVDRRTGSKFITKKPTGSDIPFTDQSPDVVNDLNVAQLAADIYISPSLDNDGLPNLPATIETQLNYRRLRRPSFRSNPADPSQVVIPASVASPAIVFINGVYYVNISDATMDLDTAGRNGLDTGVKAANTIYYLYAIPPTGGTTFDYVCSLATPAVGPTGFPYWSYLGAFHTIAGSVVAVFISSQGRFVSENPSANSHIGDINWTAKSYLQPSTIKHSFGFVYISGAGGAGDQGLVSGLSTGNSVNYTILQVNGFENQRQVEFPIFTPGTVYLKTSDAANTVGYYQLGWLEDPTDFQ